MYRTHTRHGMPPRRSDILSRNAVRQGPGTRGLLHIGPDPSLSRCRRRSNTGCVLKHGTARHGTAYRLTFLLWAICEDMDRGKTRIERLRTRGIQWEARGMKVKARLAILSCRSMSPLDDPSPPCPVLDRVLGLGLALGRVRMLSRLDATQAGILRGTDRAEQREIGRQTQPKSILSRLRSHAYTPCPGLRIMPAGSCARSSVAIYAP